MKVRFWIDGKIIDTEVVASNDRSYLVTVGKTMFQVPKHSATILDEAITNDNSL